MFWLEIAFSQLRNNSLILVILFLKFEDSTVCITLLRVQVFIVVLNWKNTIKTNFEVKCISFSKSMILTWLYENSLKPVHTNCCDIAAVLCNNLI